MNIIGNNCCGGYWYKENNLKFENPFIWMVLDFPYMLELCKNYDSIDFNKFSTYTGELDKKDYYGILVDEKIKIDYVHYRYDANVEGIKKMGVELFSKDIYNYTIKKYLSRIKRMTEEPIFMIMDYKDHYNNETTQQIINETKYHTIIFTNHDYENISDKIHIIKTNESNMWHSTLLPEDFISKCNNEINDILKQIHKNFIVVSQINTPKNCIANILKPTLIQSHGNLFNCSIFERNNETYLIGRNSNYTYINYDNSLLQYPTEQHINSDQLLYKIDLKTGNLKYVKILSNCSKEQIEKFKVCGVEDVRVARYDDQDIITYSNVEFDETIPKTICDESYCILNENFKLDKIIKIQTNKIEKNWSPILSDDYKYEYVYSYNPFITVNLKTLKFTQYENNKLNVEMRGSTQLIKYKDGFLTITHTKNNSFRYLHYFVYLDKDLNIIKISEPFTFFNMKIEFTPCIFKHDNNYCIPVSVLDQITYIFNFSEDLIDEILNKKREEDINEISFIDNIKEDMKTVRNEFGYLAACTYTKCELDDVRLIEYFDDLSIKDKYILYKTMISKTY